MAEPGERCAAPVDKVVRLIQRPPVFRLPLCGLSLLNRVCQATFTGLGNIDTECLGGLDQGCGKRNTLKLPFCRCRCALTDGDSTNEDLSYIRACPLAASLSGYGCRR